MKIRAIGNLTLGPPFKDAAPITKPVEKKKPTSPFFLYFMEKRRELLAEQPQLTTPEVGRYFIK
jgi:hypothetical protein